VMELAFEREVTVERFPFLKSHVLNGRAVVPLALAMEWLAQGALHGHPGLVFHGLEQVRVCKGIVLEGDRPFALRVAFGKATLRGNEYLVPVEVRGGTDGKQLHVRGDVILVDSLPAAVHAAALPALGDAGHLAERLYDDVLFHGPDLQGLRDLEGVGPHGIAARCSAAPPPAQWCRHPLRQSWLADPLVLDGCFQAMIAWGANQGGAPSLPCFVGSYRQFRRFYPRDGVRLAVRVTRHEVQRAFADVDLLDDQGVLVGRLQECEMVSDPGLREAFRRNRLAGEPVLQG
jgi:hypothetical protein